MTLTSQFSFTEVRQVLGSVLGPDLHAKRIDSLCSATLGVLHSGSLAVAAIGHGLAAARGVLTKHAIKQVDRSGFPSFGLRYDLRYRIRPVASASRKESKRGG
jgi:hypothetical protein